MEGRHYGNESCGGNRGRQVSFSAPDPVLHLHSPRQVRSSDRTRGTLSKVKGGSTGFAGTYFFKGRVCPSPSGSCGQESRDQSPPRDRRQIEDGGSLQWDGRARWGSLPCCLEPNADEMLSKEPCGLASGQVLSPVQGQALALCMHRPSRENPARGMSCEFGQHCCAVCVSVFSKTHRLNESGQN